MLQRAVQVDASFLVHRNPVGPGIGEGRDILIRILDHQVDIKRHIGDPAQRLHHRRANGDIGNKVPVHHIYMQQGSASCQCCLNFFCQAGKIGR